MHYVFYESWTGISFECLVVLNVLIEYFKQLIELECLISLFDVNHLCNLVLLGIKLFYKLIYKWTNYFVNGAYIVIYRSAEIVINQPSQSLLTSVHLFLNMKRVSLFL